MSPHTDAGALLKLIGAAYSDAFGEGMREHTSHKGGRPWTERKAYYENALAEMLVRQAASHGSAGGEAVAWRHPNYDYLTDDPKKVAEWREAGYEPEPLGALSRPSTGGEAETSLQNPQTSPERPDHAQAPGDSAAIECLRSIAEASDQEPREHDDADWRFRFLEAQRAARCTLSSLPSASRGTEA